MKLPVFARNVATLMTGGVIANLLSLAAIPIVSRLFNPDDFGVAALFVSITTILSTVATLRYEHAIVLPESREEAAEIATLAYFFLFISSGLVLIIAVAGMSVTGIVMGADDGAMVSCHSSGNAVSYYSQYRGEPEYEGKAVLADC